MQTLRVNKRALSRFQRRAKAAFLQGKEYIEFVGGTVSAAEISLEKFYQIKHTATNRRIEYALADFELIKEQMREDGLHYVSSLHTHPEGGEYPSDADNCGSRDAGELVTGIMSIWLSKMGKVMTKIRWWQPQLSFKNVELVKM